MRLGKYRVLRSLGRGGMGEVYLAHDPQIDRQVAIKVLREDEHSEGIFREARAAGALNHPNIVTIYDVGTEDGRDFIAMEYLPGDTLRDAVASGAMSDDEVARLFADVAEALAAAHRQGVMHRDVKPDNVMVTDAGRVKVVDFGIARRMREPEAGAAPTLASDVALALATTTEVTPASVTLAGTATIHGTPGYMAPEVLAGRPEPASDVYALGVSLYETLTGCLPYAQGDTLVDMLELVMDPDTPARPILDARGDIDPELAALVDSTLADDPARRPSMVELARQLRGRTAPAAERPPRRRWWALAVVAVAIAAVAVTAVAVASGGAGTGDSPRPRLAIAPYVTNAASAGIESRFDFTFASELANRFRRHEIDLVPAAGLRQSLGPHPSPVDGLRAALRARAPWVARIAIDERGSRTHIQLELLHLTGGGGFKVAASADRGELDTWIGRLVDLAAARLMWTPAAEIELDRRALVAYTDGVELARRAQWKPAIPALSQAVQLREEFADAWYQLALVRSWADDMDGAVAAAGRAESLWTGAPSMLMKAFVVYASGDLEGARPMLERLVGGDYDRDAEYLLAEVDYHLGFRERALERFERLYELHPHLGHAIEHLHEAALFSGDAAKLESYAKALDRPMGDDDRFALRQWSVTVTRGGLALPEAVMLGRENEIDASRGRYASSELGRATLFAWELYRGNQEAARLELDAAWKYIDEKAADPEAAAQLGPRVAHLAEVLIAAGMRAETERLLSAWKPQWHALGLRAHLLAHAALLSGRDRLPATPTANRRARWERQAIAAELDGDRGRAVELWNKLLAAPAQHTYALQLIALARNLRELGRGPELEAACARIAEPRIFRVAFLVGRARCEAWGAYPPGPRSTHTGQ